MNDSIDNSKNEAESLVLIEHNKASSCHKSSSAAMMFCTICLGLYNVPQHVLSHPQNIHEQAMQRHWFEKRNVLPFFMK